MKLARACRQARRALRARRARARRARARARGARARRASALRGFGGEPATVVDATIGLLKPSKAVG